MVELFDEQLARARAVAESDAARRTRRLGDVHALLETWIEPRRAAVERAAGVISDIEGGGGGWTFAKLTIANAALRDLAAA